MAGDWPGIAVAALRFSIGAACLGIVLAVREGRAGFRPVNAKIQIARGVSIAFSATCFFSAVYIMPLANAAVITFISPIITALISAVFLKERAPRAAWVSTLAAFCGVILVLRPNLAEIGLAGLLPVGAALGFSMVMIFNRLAAGTGSVLAMQFMVSAVAAPVLIAAALIGQSTGLPSLAITVPDINVVFRCVVVAATASLAHTFIYLATTRASAAVVAPMVYVQLLVALVLGAIFFGDRPDLTTLAGAALIIGGSLYLWHSQKEAR